MKKQTENTALTVEERIQRLSKIRTWCLDSSMDEDEFNKVWNSEGEECSVNINYSQDDGWIVYLAQGVGFSRTANIFNKKLDALPLPGGFQLNTYGKTNFEL